MKTLQIFEYHTYKSKIQEIIPIGPFKWIFLGYSYNILRELRECAWEKSSEILLQDEIEKSSIELRQQFIDYIASITTDDGAHPTIYSGLVERVPFRSDVFLDICLINAAIKKIRSSDADFIIIICEHKGIAYDLHQSVSDAPDIKDMVHVNGPVFSFKDKIIKSTVVILHTGKISAQLLFRHFVSKLHEKSISVSDRPDSEILLLHSWVAHASIESGEYKELFFPDLQEKLTRLNWPVVLMPHIPYDVNFSTTVNAIIKKQIRFLPEESCISFMDIMKIFFRTVGNIPRWSDHHLNAIHFSNSAYIQNFRDWQSLQILVPTICECIIEGLSRQKIPIRTLIFTYENNVLEKAFIKKIHQLYPETTSIGYQHSTINSNYLFYYLSKYPIDQLYVPDLVITNGKYPSRFLKKNNYPEGRILTGGALRYVSYTKSLPIQSHFLKHNNRILITLPIITDESVEILEKVFEATKDNPEFEILVKIHPFLSQAKLEGPLSVDIIKKIHYTNIPLKDILPTVNVLVYSTTSSCIEALSFGIPVLKIKSERRLDMDPLGEFQGESRFISSATQPKEIKERLLTMRELELNSRDKDEILRVIREIFQHVDAQTYLSFTRIKSKE